jgi:arylsulfatase A
MPSLVRISIIVFALVAGIVADGARPQPNIVIILADDMGYGDCGVYNPASKIPTPHIDQLAQEGLRFTDAHAASSTCTPSRYGLLTGTNPVRTGVLNTLLKRGKPVIAEDEMTIAALLQSEGYRTAMIGKWHLGFETDGNKKSAVDFSKPLRGGPLDRGFDSFFGLPSSPGSSPLCYVRGRKVELLPTETGIVEQVRGETSLRRKVLMAPGYEPAEASPLFAREALSLIHARATAKKSQPFLLYYASPIPHQPWVPSAAFKGRSGLGDYADFVMQLDSVVGQINAALKETGLDSNTLLILTSDNGPGPWAVKAMEAVGHPCTGVLRGQKSDSWEGGHRVPFIAKWPGQIPAAGVTDATINFTDLFATFAELLEVDQRAPDSVSFLPALLGTKPHRRPPMINRHAIRHGDWKLTPRKRRADISVLKPGDFALFNLATDIAEQHDLSHTHPERTQQLFAEFARFAKERNLK